MSGLLVLAIVLAIIALALGFAVKGLFLLLLIVAVVVALFAVAGGRSV